MKSVNEVIVEPDRELAIKEAHKIARENDVVLIAGKGHEDYQILANETIHFDDREKAREIFVSLMPVHEHFLLPGFVRYKNTPH